MTLHRHMLQPSSIVGNHNNGRGYASVARPWAKLVLAVVTVALLGGGAAIYFRHGADRAPAATPSPPPVPVIAATVLQRDFPIALTGIGTVTALNTATVRSQVTGMLVDVPFTEGQFVKKGDLLAQIDPRTFQAQLDEAEAALARDQAHLENAQINLGRYVPLSKQGFAPEQQVATQRAMVAQQQATVENDKAAVQYAKTELSYTKLVAPFDGVTGIRLLDVGNIIQPNNGAVSSTTGVVVVTQVQPISVVFTLPMADIPEVQDALAKGPLETIAFSQDGKTQLDTGKLLLVDNQADPTSGTVRLKAIFPNEKRRLWPGTFVNLRLVTSVEHNGLTVPLDAIQQGPQGQFVFVVGQDHKAAMRPVSVRETLTGEALIDKGLSAGESVVVRGQYRLSQGTLVAVADPNNPSAVPNPSTASSGMLP
jgi:membrane fusion protein, multidrug efflux system